MKTHKKTFLGSIIAFFVGTSCCWLTSIAIWFGGITFIGTIASLIKDIQFFIIGLGTILLTISIASYLKMRKEKASR